MLYIYNENQGAQGEGLQLHLACWPLEISYVVPEYAISVEDFRCPGAPGGGGPVGRVARVSPIGVYGE